MNTPKAFAKLRLRRNHPKLKLWLRAEHNFKSRSNPETVRRLANPFRVQPLFNVLIPGLSLRSNHWAKISERLRRNHRNRISERVRRSLVNAFGVIIQN